MNLLINMFFAAPLFSSLVVVAIISTFLMAVCTVKSVAYTKYTNEYGMAGRIVWQHALRFNIQLWFAINMAFICMWVLIFCVFIKFVGFK